MTKVKKNKMKTTRKQQNVKTNKRELLAPSVETTQSQKERMDEMRKDWEQNQLKETKRTKKQIEIKNSLKMRLIEEMERFNKQKHNRYNI